MAIGNGELRKIAALFTLFLGFVILAEPAKAWLSQMVPTSAWLLGLGVLLAAAWQFNY